MRTPSLVESEEIRVNFKRTLLTACAIYLIGNLSFARSVRGNGCRKVWLCAGQWPQTLLRNSWQRRAADSPSRRFWSRRMLAPMMPALSQHRQVITVDLQAHGRTADIDRPITFEVMADDIAGLAKYLGITKADVMGLPWRRRRVAYGFQHPELVKRLISVSVAFRRDGCYREIVTAMSRVGAASAEP